MRIFVAGATGVLGRRTVQGLVADGHEVTGIARGPEKAALLERLGARPVEASMFEPEGLAAAVAGHEAVCSLATRIPSIGRAAWPRAWAENDRIRTVGVPNLVDAALAAGASRFVQESITFGLADGGDLWLDEDSPLDPPPYARSTEVANAAVHRFADAAGRIGVVLRFAAFYSADSHMTVSTAAAVRRRLSPYVGRDGYVSSIHVDDAASAVVAALTAPSGTYLVGDDEPLTRADHVGALASALGVKAPWIPPRWVAAPLGGRGQILVRSHRVSNRRFRDATGWAPAYPTVRVGWPAVVAELAGVQAVRDG
jgi:nucleoside-diphosphate-sugar epimerase